MENFIEKVLYADNATITWWAMATRGFILYFLTLLYIRIGGNRMFSGYGAFDIVIAIMLGALFAKAIEGSAKFLPAIITGLIMVLLHRMLAMVSVKNHFIGNQIKGKPALLVKNGEMQKEEMRRTNISEEDLLEAMRLNSLHDLSKTKEVYLERNGKISFVP